MTEKKYVVQEHLHYAGIPSWNHCEISRNLEGADIAVAGVPFDSGVTFRPGARFAPRAVREQSLIACCFKYPWDYYLNDAAKIIDYGDIGYWVGAYATEYTIKDTYDTVTEILRAGAAPMIIGGDHTIPYGPIRACAKKYGSLSLIHFDAHQDSTPSQLNPDGTKNLSHANFTYDLQEEGCIDPSKSVQLYCRTEFTECGYTVIKSMEALDHTPSELATKIKNIVGSSPVYLTFDIDALDPSVAPETCTPVFGGPSADTIKKAATPRLCRLICPLSSRQVKYLKIC